jgi:NADP-dependent 3-hydroxy acid dehydrogenase YdfG
VTAPTFDLTGRTAIVTGGSRGLGRAIALGYAAAGARVVVASRKADACEAVADEIRTAGGEALAVATHVGRSGDIDALVAATVEWSGGIDIVVNNAANPLGGSLADVTPLAFEKAYGVNVLGPLLLCQAALGALTHSDHASIINVITVGAFRGGEQLGLYCSSKAALWNLTGIMAKEWAPRRIRPLRHRHDGEHTRCPGVPVGHRGCRGATPDCRADRDRRSGAALGFRRRQLHDGLGRHRRRRHDGLIGDGLFRDDLIRQPASSLRRSVL